MKIIQYQNIKKQQFIDRLREQIIFNDIEKYIKIYNKEYVIKTKKTYIISELEIEYNNYNFDKITNEIINNINNNYNLINNILDDKIQEYGIIKKIYKDHFSINDNYIKLYCYNNDIDFNIMKDILKYNKVKDIKSFINELNKNNKDKFPELIIYLINYYENNNIRWCDIFTFIYALININGIYFEKYYHRYSFNIKDILFEKLFNKQILIEHYKIKIGEDKIKNNNKIILYALHCYIKFGKIQQEL